MKKTSILLYACFIAALASGAGCKKEESPPPSPPADAGKEKPAAAPPPPVHAAVSSATAGGTLDFRARKDPFKPYAMVPPAPAPGAAPVPKARPAEDLLPIQSFETSKFKVAGIIAGITENRALVIDPNGKGYVVQKGMLIGNNDGRVSRITSNSVEVVERYREDTGRARQRTIVLTLTTKR